MFSNPKEPIGLIYKELGVEELGDEFSTAAGFMAEIVPCRCFALKLWRCQTPLGRTRLLNGFFPILMSSIPSLLYTTGCGDGLRLPPFISRNGLDLA
jgi:hypothetical protein